MRLAWHWPAWIVLIVALSPPAGAEIYRWTDEEGRLHFTEQLSKVPPRYREQAKREAASSSDTPRVQSYSGAAVAAPADRSPRPGGPGGEVHIPFERFGSLMRVEATVNDLIRVPFLIDTGASGVSIPAAYAERLGIRIRPDTPYIEVHTAAGVVPRAVVELKAVEVGGARVENLTATVNPAMDVGLLGGTFFNNFVYRVDAAASVITLSPNENLRGGLGEDEWRARFRTVTGPLQRLESYLREHPSLHDDERAELAARQAELEARLAALERDADRLGVPQIWRD
jgi:clan AA aspartic protease (TIGR02281 family)